MKRKFFTFITLLAAGLSLSSCLSSDDDNDVVYSHDTAISAFSLGTMGRYKYTTKIEEGQVKKDSSLVASAVAGSDYKFTIDQANRQIYNEDSLPVGTRIAASLATISAKNSSYIQLIYAKDKLKDKKYEDSLVWYSSSDSINFKKLPYIGLDEKGNPSSNIRRNNIRVFAQDGTVYADYQLKINVHKEEADFFVWKPLATSNAKLIGLDSIKTVALGDGTIYVFGKPASTDKKTIAYFSTNGNTWNKVNHEFGANAYESIAGLNGVAYVVDDNGKVYSSANAWAEVPANISPIQLLGAGSKYLYARTATGIAASEDGKTWKEQALDEVVDSLPTRSVNLNAVSIASTKNAENLLLLGIHPIKKEDVDKGIKAHGDTIAVVWTHTADYNVGASLNKWNYVDYDKNQRGKLPYLSQVVVSTSSDGLVALGSNKTWYKSLDGGLTWKKDTTMTLPEGFDAAKPFALTRVKKTDNIAPNGKQYDTYFYWLINNGNVWKGRFNKDGWLKKD